MDKGDEPMDVGDPNSDSSSSSDDENQELNNESELINDAADWDRVIRTHIVYNTPEYDPHIRLIDIYRKLGELDALRAAYQRFHEYFPLTPKLWLNWLRDEMKIANTPEEKKRLFSLFDKAVEDYLSVELWIEYAQYSIGASDLETTRSILERGLTAGGLHVSEGSLLWDTLRELEHAHISLKEEGSDEWKAQVKKLADVFKRQLSVPLLGMDGTYEEWQEWVKTLPEGIVDPKPVDWGYNNAVTVLETYKPFEERLLTAEGNDVYNVYKEYIDKVKDPSTVLCLYERAVATLCLVPDLWMDYCLYAFNLGETALKVCSKALRNCPWSEELWVMKLRIMENLNMDKKEVWACFQEALTKISSGCGLELWLAYLEYLHRTCNDENKLDDFFSKAVEQMGNESDPSCKLSRWHARLLAKRGDMATARKIWGTILHHTQNKGQASVWLEYINLEKRYGDAASVRRLFQRAHASCTDWPQFIDEEWLMFERENGTLDDVLKCYKKIRSAARVPTQSAQENVSTETSDPVSQGTKRKHGTGVESFKSKKSKRDMPEERRKEKPEPVRTKHMEKDPKRTVFVSNLHPSVGEEKLKELFPNSIGIELVKDRKGKSRCYGFVQFSKEEEAMTALARDRTPLDGRPVFISEVKPDRTERKPEFKYAMTTETNKLFVRGLPKTKSKGDVEELFKPYNPTDVRLVMARNGQSKGLAYVEFESEQAALKALKATDQMKVDDQVITVAISAPPPKKTNVKVSEPVRHARSRLSVSLIPRSLQVKAKKEEEATNGSGGKGEGSKSNEDFRKMLLKK